MTNQHLNGGPYSLRSGVTIYASQATKIDRILTKLITKTPARFLLLSDVTGQVVSAQGARENTDLVALGSLVAGDLAASQEIARLTGEYQDYQMVLREGQTSHTFIVGAGLYLALLVQVSNEVPLGWARMLIRQAAHELAEVLDTQPEETDHRPRDEPMAEIEQEELSNLFDDALDELWSE